MGGGDWKHGETCKRCGLCPDEDQHVDSLGGYAQVTGLRPNTYVDPCLGFLPGVSNACCGHGDPESSYIGFENGVVIRNFTVIESAVVKMGLRHEIEEIQAKPRVLHVRAIHDYDHIEFMPFGGSEEFSVERKCNDMENED